MLVQWAPSAICQHSIRYVAGSCLLVQYIVIVADGSLSLRNVLVYDDFPDSLSHDHVAAVWVCVEMMIWTMMCHALCRDSYCRLLCYFHVEHDCHCVLALRYHPPPRHHR